MVFTLTTKRLVLRDFTPIDWLEVHAYASDPDVAKFMIWGPNNEEETKGFINSSIEMQQQEPRVDFECAVILQEADQLIGGCGIRKEGMIGEIGYCFNPLFWRKGYASEAAYALIDYGFNVLGLHRIFATCRPENVGSAKVMERVGMQREGHLREHMWHKGKWHDSYLYSILKHDWETQSLKTNSKILITQADESDLADILALQYLAYKSEAKIYKSPFIQPLTQTIEELQQESMYQVILKATFKGRLVGSVRAYNEDGTCKIGKLIVHPTVQNQRIGTKLMLEIEKIFKECQRYELFTGNKSERNIYLYNKMGYHVFKSEEVSSNLKLIYMEKINGRVTHANTISD